VLPSPFIRPIFTQQIEACRRFVDFCDVMEPVEKIPRGLDQEV